MNGIIIINKSKGLSSSRVGHKVRKMLDLKKVGHLGTLDPMATGVLPLCVNEGTKLVQFLSDVDKEYVATLKLGIETDTQDSEGNILKISEEIPTDLDAIRSVVQGFKGEFFQIPPMYSALKHRGVPLYKLARKGESVPRQERRVVVYDIDILEVNIPYVTFRLVCSGGTYVRTLCHDIGQKLSCGAHMTSLKRTRSGPFHINQALEIEDIGCFVCKGAVEEYLVSPKDALIGLTEVIVSEELVNKVKNGVQIKANDISEIDMPDFKAGQKIKIISPRGVLVGVGEALLDKKVILSGAKPEDKAFKSVRVFSVEN